VGTIGRLERQPGNVIRPVIRRLRTAVRALRDDRRALGWRGLLRKRGWRLVLAFVAFYLVRDLILYVLIPLALVMGLSK